MIKKILLTFSILFLLIGMFFVPYTALCSFDIEGEYTLYTVDNDKPFVYTTGDNAQSLYLSYDSVAGEAWTFSGLDTLWYMVDRLDMSVVSTERIGDIDIVYCYTDKLSSYLICNGGRVNIQIAIYEDDTVKVGYPLILDGY